MDDLNMFDEEILRKIDKRKLEIISRMLSDMKNKNADEKLQVLFTYGMDMKSKGMKFTKEESALLISMLKVNLSPEEKDKMDMITNILKTM